MLLLIDEKSSTSNQSQCIRYGIVFTASAMTTVLLISFNFSALKTTHGGFCKKPIYYNSLSSSKIGSLRRNGLKPRVSRRERWFSLRGSWGRVLLDEGWKRKRRMVLMRFNQGFGFNGGGGGGGGGRDNARLLGNIAFAIGLTYLSVTGQLGWVLDAIVSIWLIAVLIPIVGLGAFIWWAGRDIIQGQCPNCGNDFQVFKSTLNDELQLCPFCSQPFSVVDNKFVSDPVKFSNQSTTFGEAFGASGFKKGKDSSATVVDVEAEIKDAD